MTSLRACEELPAHMQVSHSTVTWWMNNCSRRPQHERRALKPELIKHYMIYFHLFNPIYSIQLLNSTINEAIGCESSISLIQKLMKGHKWTEKIPRFYGRALHVKQDTIDFAVKSERLHSRRHQSSFLSMILLIRKKRYTCA